VDMITAVILVWTMIVLLWALAEAVERLPRS